MYGDKGSDTQKTESGEKGKLIYVVCNSNKTLQAQPNISINNIW